MLPLSLICCLVLIYTINPHYSDYMYERCSIEHDSVGLNSEYSDSLHVQHSHIHIYSVALVVASWNVCLLSWSTIDAVFEQLYHDTNFGIALFQEVALPTDFNYKDIEYTVFETGKLLTTPSVRGVKNLGLPTETMRVSK